VAGAGNPSKFFYFTCLAVCMVLMAISCVAPFSGCWFLDLKPATDSSATWFERTGAVTTIFSLLAINLMDDSMNRLVDPRKNAGLESISLYMKLERPVAFLKAFAFILSLVGTAIWGYGTVIINEFPWLGPIISSPGSC
jgi:hypothetical protein